MVKKSLFLCSLTCCLMISPAFAQTIKVGYIDLEKIQQTYKGFKDIQVQFDKAVKESQDKVRVMREEVDDLKQKYEARKLMMTEEKRKEDEQVIDRKEQDLLQYIQSTQQELAQKEQTLLKPLQEKIFGIVSTLAKTENYTYVFDSSALIYVDPVKGSDLTGRVLEELQKEVK
ncbi:MAG: OmpH family outer membrane protein [Candidatus Latescibacteria bacterium]|nr:OmpH family outer membrane protein [Candidatus Latescibacterota bacterium]